MKNTFILTLLLFTVGAYGKWYKGNTHTHTKLSGHGDTPPAEVAKWYHDRGYHFLVLSEHNKFIDPKTIEIKDQRDDFILIGGVEVTGPKHVHTTALNVSRVIPLWIKSDDPGKIVQYHVDEVLKAGGVPILNHPNWQYALRFDDILPVEKLEMFELFNGHPHVNNHGDHDHISTEELWDKLLSSGKRIWGVSSDDAHYFSKLGPQESNPGRGWVMVNATKLTSDAIVAAMKKGDFYSCNGVYLKELKIGKERILLEVDTKRSLSEIKRGFLQGKHSHAKGEDSIKIEFIGKNGKTLSTVNKSRAVFRLDQKEEYVRAKVTLITKTKNGRREFYAWTQPIF